MRRQAISRAMAFTAHADDARFDATLRGPKLSPRANAPVSVRTSLNATVHISRVKNSNAVCPSHEPRAAFTT